MSSKIKRAYIDVDPIAYAGAFAAEKANYQWVKKDGSQESEVFNTALEAKEFKEFEELQGEDFDNDWERIKGKRYGTLEEAFKGCDGVIEDYQKTAYELTGNPDIEFIGYMTSSDAPKVKDIGGIENRYQGNRDPNSKPKLLKECREHLLNTYDWIKMAAVGFEADTHIIAKCEQDGEEAVGLFIDKDLAQMEDGQFVDMKRPKKLRSIIKTTKLGELWEEENARGVKSIKGHGFKWLCLQAAAGDPADGYFGFKGLGDKKVYPILKDCKTKKECVQSLLAVYTDKMKDGLRCDVAKEQGAKLKKGKLLYMSWDGKRKTVDAKELLAQHLFLAYQERGAKDSINIEDYLDEEA